MTSLGESREQKQRVLNVGDGVGAGILGRKHAASFFRGKGVVGNGEQQGPLPFWTDRDRLDVGAPGHTGYGEAAHPTGGGIVGMVLAAGGLADDLGVGPAQAAEVTSQGDTCETGSGGRAATFADRDVVLNPKRQWNDGHRMGLKNLAIGGEDEMILHVAADFLVAPGDSNGEGRGRTGVDRDVEIHGQRRSVEGRP